MPGSQNSATRGSYGSTPYDHAMHVSDSQYVLCNVDKLSYFLDLEEPFTARDVKFEQSYFGPLKRKNVVEQVGTIYDEDVCRELKTWRLTDGARERLEATLSSDREAELPCGDAGWVNDPDVDGVRCKTCDEVFPKAVLR